MKLYSLKNPHIKVDLRTAVLDSLPEDGSLYMPEQIQKLPSSFFDSLTTRTFAENSFLVARCLLDGALPEKDLEELVFRAINFPAPLVQIDERLFVLELFHGPSLAFKDFGARFMAELMRYFNQNIEKKLTILVATSGDTGGAVAAGFYNTPGVEVVILYPKGKVSAFQKKQLTTLGSNIHALEVDGTFDDCQRMVKLAFNDVDVKTQLRLTSANSINIARLIPQSFYYFELVRQWQLLERRGPVLVSVPSGNFGNLTAGVFAREMGLPVEQFIASNNANDMVVRFLQTKEYQPKDTIPTISNAMDVGNPSNFMRLYEVFQKKAEQRKCSTWNIFNEELLGYSFSDFETEEMIRAQFENNGYVLDPHTAVGVLGAKRYLASIGERLGDVVVLGTAHPCKFKPVVEPVISNIVDIPLTAELVFSGLEYFSSLPNDYFAFKSWLLEAL